MTQTRPSGFDGRPPVAGPRTEFCQMWQDRRATSCHTATRPRSSHRKPHLKKVYKHVGHDSGAFSPHDTLPVWLSSFFLSDDRRKRYLSMGRPNDRDRPDDDRRNERDRDRDKTYERDRDHERGRRAAGPPPNEGYTWHHAVQGGWQLSFGHHAPGHPPGRLECPALLYDPTVFDVVLVPHPLVPQVTGMVNEYMRTRPPLSHSDTRYYGEDQSQKKSTPTAPLQCQSHRGNQLTDATLERMDPRQSTSFAQRPSIPSAPPSAQRRIPPPTPSYYHEDIENIRPASQLHQQPLPPQRQPQPQPQYPIPRPQQPPPHLQPHPQPQPHSAMQAAPNRQYYRPSAWPNGRSFLPQDSIPPLPTPRLKSVSDRRMS
ncbi:hypothetical protein NEOLEDRAFT_712916 [Neolentinus lepideus HHB14362 ss-1]|uniref:Uncharacterized protein n=1 Tax=Neolentinus lepideus HHB14362 ss-1 TaxID=1314782 RepID=A0A165Q4E2_9AGAM|nr:hypothetical protein NEOLEDRAFT_712916 [Neolentinus lepideus HHB14362 ss-1]